MNVKDIKDCLFCKIINKSIKTNVIYEDEHVVAFLDIMSRAMGHALVIPKDHVATLVEFPDGKLKSFFGGVKHVDKLLVSALRPDGMTIGINQGRASGQEVDHLHVHLMPRWHNDGGGSIQSVVNKPSKESLEIIAKRILGT